MSQEYARISQCCKAVGLATFSADAGARSPLMPRDTRAVIEALAVLRPSRNEREVGMLCADRVSTAALQFAAVALLALSRRPAPTRRTRRRLRSTARGKYGSATPGSQRDFTQNVGDIVYFSTDQTDLTPEATQTLAEAGAVAAAVSAVHHHHRRPCRRARHARIQHRARRQARHLGAQLPRAERHQRQPHPHHLLRQGASGGGLQRHLVLVAESPRADGPEFRRADQPALIAESLSGVSIKKSGAPTWPAALLFCGSAHCECGRLTPSLPFWTCRSGDC